MALTHDVGGVNFSLQRKRNACTKSNGYVQWSNSATAQATRCQGLAEIYDGTYRDHCYWDNGKFYVYDSANDPVDRTASGITHKQSNDLYSIIKVGNYIVFSDYGNLTPYKWKHDDANASKLIASGTEYTFRYLENFQRRVIGAYSDQTNGDIDIRWSTDWPTTAITALNFPAANQLYVPNDDSIVGIRKMGRDRCYVYCENSIQQLVYFPDYTAPFRCYTVLSGHGGVNQASIVSIENVHFFFSPVYGFSIFNGQQVIPIGQDIETDSQNINSSFYAAICGTYIPFTRQIVWAVPMGGSPTPTHLFFYHIDTKQWTIEDKAMRYVDQWKMSDSYTMTDLINDATAAGYSLPTMTDILTWKGSMVTMAEIVPNYRRLVYGGTDGQLYYQETESLNGAALDSYRIEPIMDFGNPYRKDILQEIWLDLAAGGNFSIDIYYRGGNTVEEVEGNSWTLLGSISCNHPVKPVLYTSQTNRFHQIKWGTDGTNEKYTVSKITFKYMEQSE